MDPERTRAQFHHPHDWGPIMLYQSFDRPSTAPDTSNLAQSARFTGRQRPFTGGLREVPLLIQLVIVGTTTLKALWEGVMTNISNYSSGVSRATLLDGLE